MSCCHCCSKPLPIQHAHNRKRPANYCDAICYAAGSMLSVSALKIWRNMCYKLDVSPTRTMT